MTRAEQVRIARQDIRAAVEYYMGTINGETIEYQGFVNLPKINLALKDGYIVTDEYIQGGPLRTFILSYKGQVMLTAKGNAPRAIIKVAPWLWQDIIN